MGADQALHSEAPSDPEAQRVANWLRFGARDRRSVESANQETFDLDAIERDHLRPSGHVLEVALATGVGEEGKRKAEHEFRRRIKQYTSGSKPHHCLVELIEIEAPSEILDQGVTLIDTPGLDDTERFRVQLTERAVQDVDAVLFLTKSGAAYGQSEKEFLLSLLRKGTVKQLIFIVTQFDQTYEQHVRQAKDQDEEPQTLLERISSERLRVRREIESTLDEVSGDLGHGATQRFREQLDAIEIAFTSAANHRDWVRRDPVRFPLQNDDPGGIIAATETLYSVLSSESRLASARQAILAGAAAIFSDMLSVIENRRAAVRGLRSREVAENKLTTFRSQFKSSGGEFSLTVDYDVSVLSDSLRNRAPIGQLLAENIALQADEVLGSYETDDAGRHWRTRRSGYWGYMHNLQSRVANRIFPRVAAHLNDLSAAFCEFAEKFKFKVRNFSKVLACLLDQLEFGSEIRVDIVDVLDKFVTTALEQMQELVEGEETTIIALLENFVDEQVEDRITAARDRVGNIFGRGTTVNQTAEVKAFYREVRTILKKALQDHVEQRFRDFASHLVSQAEALPKHALSEIDSQIDRVSANIRIAAEAAIAGQKENFERSAINLTQEIEGARAELAKLIGDTVTVVNEVPTAEEVCSVGLKGAEQEQSTAAAPPVCQPIPREVEPQADNIVEQEIYSRIQSQATVLQQRYVLRNGARGWPYSKFVTSDLLKGATEGWLIDPYLAQHHQRRNLTEFVIALMAAGKLKSLHIVTRAFDDRSIDWSFYEDLDRDAFEKAGMKITCEINDTIHDRFFILDNGIVCKLGRGLDIYKPAVGLASRDPALRRVRSCEIDIFAAE